MKSIEHDYQELLDKAHTMTKNEIGAAFDSTIMIRNNNFISIAEIRSIYRSQNMIEHGKKPWMIYQLRTRLIEQAL